MVFFLEQFLSSEPTMSNKFIFPLDQFTSNEAPVSKTVFQLNQFIPEVNPKKEFVPKKLSIRQQKNLKKKKILIISNEINN